MIVDDIGLEDSDIIDVENECDIQLHIDPGTPYIYLTDEDIMKLARLRGLIA